VDLFRQRKKHAAQMRMSKQEIKEEHKESDGNPMVRMKIRRLQRDMARRNMMKAIPTATAVIVNPTHYAVAIRYQVDSMAAPTVVAKGKNYLALRIRKRALEHQVPIVENVPLAQALYTSADVGQEIPTHLYRAVAEILAYIFKLMNGKMPGQV
jgi:flagellar biosynthetic protein FlhB